MRKKIIALIVAFAICEVGFVNTPLKVFAEILCEEKAEEELKEEEPLMYLLQEEEKKSTEIMDENVEKILNSQGIFDAELELFSDKEIEEIENAEKLQVVNEYIEVIEKDNELTGSIENEEKIMNDNEIDDVISEIFYSDNVNKDNVIKKIGKEVGIIPEDVYGKTIEANSTSYVKRSFVIIEFDGIMSVTGINNWLKMPQNRYTDVVSYSWSGAHKYDKDCYKAISKTQYTFDITTAENGKNIRNMTEYGEEDFSYLLKKNNNYGENHLIAAFDLPENDDEYAARGYYMCKKLETFCYKVTFYLKKEAKTFSMSYNYQHQKEKVDGVSAFAVSAGIAGIAISAFIPVTTTGTIAGIFSLISESFFLDNLFIKYYKTIGQDGSFEYKFK